MEVVLPHCHSELPRIALDGLGMGCLMRVRTCAARARPVAKAREQLRTCLAALVAACMAMPSSRAHAELNSSNFASCA